VGQIKQVSELTDVTLDGDTQSQNLWFASRETFGVLLPIGTRWQRRPTAAKC
jgi:hypothetical protein